jgi:hypothetical protein
MNMRMYEYSISAESTESFQIYSFLFCIFLLSYSLIWDIIQPFPEPMNGVDTSCVNNFLKLKTELRGFGP